MYKIGKQFDFCYGHRVWSQTLNPEFSMDSCLKCRHLHGHQGNIWIGLEASVLHQGMVTDFKHLNWFKKWLDDVLDHKFIMDINDPLFPTLVPSPEGLKEVPVLWFDQGYGVVDLSQYEHVESEVVEMLEGMVFVQFVPTSENLSRWLFDLVQERMKPLGVTVSQVQFFETSKSQSNYYGEI